MGPRDIVDAGPVQAHGRPVEAGLADIEGLEPIATSSGSQRGGYYGFPIRFRGDKLGGVSLEEYIKALAQRGLQASASGYPALHTLPYFAKGFDLFTGGRGPFGKGWNGYKPGDFPVTEQMLRELLFLPVLSDPVPGAARTILKILRQTAAAVAK
jgi:perosamine synthetase